MSKSGLGDGVGAVVLRWAVRGGALRAMRRWWSIRRSWGVGRGSSTGATEWDQRGIGSSKDGNRDWGRNVV